MDAKDDAPGCLESVCDGCTLGTDAAVMSATQAVGWGELEGDATGVAETAAVFRTRRADGALDWPDTLEVLAVSTDPEVGFRHLAERSLASSGTLPHIYVVATGRVRSALDTTVILGVRDEDYGGEIHLVDAPVSDGPLDDSTLLVRGAAGAELGRYVAAIPDRDGDGDEELLLAASAASGVVFLVDVEAVATGRAAYDDQPLFGDEEHVVGAGIYPAGDLDGDGLADAMVDAGRRLLLIPSHWEWPARPGDAPASIDLFTASAASYGDSTGDGYDDVAVVPHDGSARDGDPLLSVYPGPFFGPVAADEAVMTLGAGSQPWPGTIEIAPSADLEGDARVDWTVWDLSQADPASSDRVYSIYRIPGGLCGRHTFDSPLARVVSDSLGDGFGSAVAQVPDIDGDGFEDLVVDSYETMYLFSGTVFMP